MITRSDPTRITSNSNLAIPVCVYLLLYLRSLYILVMDQPYSTFSPYEWITTVAVLIISFTFLLHVIKLNLKTNELLANPKFHDRTRFHPLDLSVGLSETTYGTHVRSTLSRSDLRHHVFRFYLDGSNAPKDPWTLDVDTPPGDIVDQTRWRNFAQKELITAFSWNKSSWVFTLLYYAYPPVARWLLKRERLSIAACVCQVVAKKGSSIWASSRARAVGDMYSLKFGCDESSATVGWFDFLDLHQAKSDGTRVVVRLGGDGSYNFPHLLDTVDPYTAAHVVNHEYVVARMSKSSRRHLGSRNSSYTMLRDVLVEQLGDEKISNDMCVVTESTEPEEGTILVVKSRKTPLTGTEINAVSEPILDQRNIWIDRLTYPLKICLQPDPFPQLVIPDTLGSRTVFNLSLAILLIGIARFHTIHLIEYSTISPWWVLVAELTPPVANETAVSLGLTMMALGMFEWGRYMVLFLLCSVITDCLGAAVTGLVLSHISAILLKMMTCILVNKLLWP